MKHAKRLLTLLLALALTLSIGCIGAQAKTVSLGQTVDMTLFYVRNAAGEDILVSHIPVSEMEADLAAGRIDTANHNYSILDRYVTTVHQEAQGFTVGDYVDYARARSTIDALRTLPLRFAGEDKISFWEIDQTGFDDMDTYTYNALYGVARYNFPALYEYWNYRTQDYGDPAGVMSRDETVEHIFASGEPETVLLSVRAYSQRYIATDEKYGTDDFNMENAWQSAGKLDNQRTIRFMKPMTEEELRDKTPTASDTRYWVANIRLDMAEAPELAPLGAVAAPEATMTEDAENYYITFTCATPGALILYNHNYISPSYTPTRAYSGGTVTVPKSAFPDGTVTMTCRAVRDGWTDAGVTTLTLRSSGEHKSWTSPYDDVAESDWFFESVAFATDRNLITPTARRTFSPNAPMTRWMLAGALWRMAGCPEPGAALPFADVAANASYAKAVAWCAEKGVVKGVSATAFDPDATIRREQLVTMFARYAELVAGADMTPESTLARYDDRGELSEWAIAGMRWAVAAGIITGMTDSTVAPNGTATRAQCAAMLERLARYIG